MCGELPERRPRETPRVSLGAEAGAQAVSSPGARPAEGPGPNNCSLPATERSSIPEKRFLALQAGILFTVKAFEFSLSPPPFLEWKLLF